MAPILPILLLGGGVLTWLAFRQGPGGSAAAVTTDLAERVATKGPRGEYAFKPELAESMVRSLSAMTYTYPEATERRLVNIKPEPSGKPIALSTSAYGWAASLNKTQSILAPLFMATATVAQTSLRAVDPGTESVYAGPGGMYAVLLYAGALDKGLAPPGTPPTNVSPNVVVPMDPISQIRAEIANQQLANAVVDLLQNGQNPDELDRVAKELDGYGFTKSAAFLRMRATTLRAQLPQPGPQPAPIPGPGPGPSPTPYTPPYIPPPSPPTPSAEVAMYVVNAPSGLNIRSAPNTSAAVLGGMHNGDTFMVSDSSPGWAKGRSSAGVTGWASTAYLSTSPGGGAQPVPSPRPTPSASNYYTVVNAPNGLRIRSVPSTNGAQLGMMPNGATFAVDSTQSGWAHGSYADPNAGPDQGVVTGWSSLDYLRAGAGASTPGGGGGGQAQTEPSGGGGGQLMEVFPV